MYFLLYAWGDSFGLYIWPLLGMILWGMVLFARAYFSMLHLRWGLSVAKRRDWSVGKPKHWSTMTVSGLFEEVLYRNETPLDTEDMISLIDGRISPLIRASRLIGMIGVVSYYAGIVVVVVNVSFAFQSLDVAIHDYSIKLLATATFQLVQGGMIFAISIRLLAYVMETYLLRRALRLRDDWIYAIATARLSYMSRAGGLLTTEERERTLLPVGGFVELVKRCVMFVVLMSFSTGFVLSLVHVFAVVFSEPPAKRVEALWQEAPYGVLDINDKRYTTMRFSVPDMTGPSNASTYLEWIQQVYPTLDILPEDWAFCVEKKDHLFHPYSPTRAHFLLQQHTNKKRLTMRVHVYPSGKLKSVDVFEEGKVSGVLWGRTKVKGLRKSLLRKMGVCLGGLLRKRRVYQVVQRGNKRNVVGRMLRFSPRSRGLVLDVPLMYAKAP
ncbi:MAG: hypothetical protein CL920_38780 [Deltaproteobacteria bacterium]|nr:hypothetical protein [Deltaproteobacteria bacterium]|tara:strand:- start:3231 stop:4547 length:1317 start_codon:yes stop_codon:yes gene_type:complete